MQTKTEKMLKGIMIQRDLTRRHLAEKAGLSVRTIHNVFCGCNLSQITLAKIEYVIQEPITCTTSELQSRNVIAREIGADPGSISLRDLRKRAKPFGVRITRRSRLELISDLKAVIQKQKEEKNESQ